MASAPLQVVCIAVVSLDGCLTRHDQPGAGGWASPEDQQHFVALAATCDVRVFGASTYRADRGRLRAACRPGIRRVVMTRSPDAFADDAIDGQLEFTADTPDELVRRLSAEGHARLALLGGGDIYNLWFGAGLVDELHLTVEPRVFGTGTRLAGDHSPIDAAFTLVSHTPLNASTLLLVYRRGDAAAT